MTPREAVIELEQAIGQAIVRYERAVPSGICIGIFIDRQPDGFKVKPRLKTRPPSKTAETEVRG
jgi:hypothetical protein